MKIKILAISILFMTCSMHGFSQSFNSISRKISKYEFASGIRKVKKDYYYNLRKKLYSMYKKKLSFILKSDTLFLLESSSMESSSTYGKIWNSIDAITYIYYNDTISFAEKDAKIYTDYTCKLIENWDIRSIRLEEKKSSMIPCDYIYATRVIKIKKRIKIDSIRFKEFFLYERDK